MINKGIAVLGTGAIALLLSAGVVLAQTASPSPTSSPRPTSSPTASPTVPTGAPSTGHGGS